MLYDFDVMACMLWCIQTVVGRKRKERHQPSQPDADEQ